MRDRIEGILASAMTGVSYMAHANEILQFSISCLTVLWWLRLWIKNPDIAKPPKIEPEPQNQNDPKNT